MGTITLQKFSSSILSGYTEYIQNVGVGTLSYGAFNNSEKNKTIINKYLVANANILFSSLSNTIMMTQIVSKGQPLKVSVSVTGNGILETDTITDANRVRVGLEMLTASYVSKWYSSLRGYQFLRSIETDRWFTVQNGQETKADLILPASYNFAVILLRLYPLLTKPLMFLLNKRIGLIPIPSLLTLLGFLSVA